MRSMNRPALIVGTLAIATNLALFAVAPSLGTAQDATADQPYQKWLKYFEGEWTQVFMGQSIVIRHQLGAGGHASLMQAGDDVVGLTGWEADTETMVTHIYASQPIFPPFLRSRSTDIGDDLVQSKRIGVLPLDQPFTGTDTWRKIDNDNCELSVEMQAGTAELSATVKMARSKGEDSSTTKPRAIEPVPSATADQPYQKWLKYMQGDWDVALADGRETVFHQKLVAGGRALINQPDDGALMLTGWRPDNKTVLQTVYTPEGGYQHAAISEITDSTMSGKVHGKIPGIPVTYKGTVVWRKIDKDAYEVDFDLDIGGLNFKATSKLKRKTASD